MSKVQMIEELIKKYFEGETSLQEEEQLQNFFKGEDIPAHLNTYKSQFNLSHLLSNQSSSLNEDHLFSKLASETKIVQMRPAKSPWVTMTRVAAAAALLIIGFWGGNQLLNYKMSEVEQELVQMKALMLEQLDSNSASGRLQAVSNSTALPNSDKETIDVLIAVMKNDENELVRAKAAEALVTFDQTAIIAKALNDALLTEQEPTVLISLIESVKVLRQKSSIKALEELVNQDNVLKDVKDEAHLGIFQLKEL